MNGHVHFPIRESAFPTKNQVSKKTHKIPVRSRNSLGKIILVCPYKSVAEVPGVFFEEIVIDVEAKTTQILDGKDSCGPGVTLAESMNLPDSGDKTGNMLQRNKLERMVSRSGWLS